MQDKEKRIRILAARIQTLVVAMETSGEKIQARTLKQAEEAMRRVQKTGESDESGADFVDVAEFFGEKNQGSKSTRTERIGRAKG